MIKDDIQASINMCIALEIKNKIKLTGVIDTLKRAKKVEELLGLYRYLDENANDYDLDYEIVEETHNKIVKLEEEMK